MRSQQARPHPTPITAAALMDYGDVDIDLYPMTPLSTAHDMDDDDDDIQISQSSIAVTPRIYDTPTSGRTPKVRNKESCWDSTEWHGLIK